MKKNQILTKLVLFFVISGFSTTALTQNKAEEKPEQEKTWSYNPAKSWQYSLGFEKMSFDSKVADEEGVDSSANFIKLDAEYFYLRNVSTKIGFGFLQYKDRRGFRQTTRDNFGDVENSSSDADALPIYVDVGYKHFFETEKPSYVTARLGMSTLFASERSIPSCTNCYEESIDISGGIYMVLGAGVRVGNTWGVGINYNSYANGDIENTLGFDVIWNF